MPGVGEGLRWIIRGRESLADPKEHFGLEE